MQKRAPATEREAGFQKCRTLCSPCVGFTQISKIGPMTVTHLSCPGRAAFCLPQPNLAQVARFEVQSDECE